MPLTKYGFNTEKNVKKASTALWKQIPERAQEF